MTMLMTAMTATTPRIITPNWSAPAQIKSAMSTRVGGVSPVPFDGFNLGYSTADARENVQQNERLLAQALRLNADDIRWVHQVHGTQVMHAEALPINIPLGGTSIQADAVVSHTRGLIAAVKVADCMPVLFAAKDGSVVAAVHAGWRGLQGGILEATIAACNVLPSELVAWMGPCIGPLAFEVGEEVRAAFAAHDAAANQCFLAKPNNKYLCDLSALARMRLRAAGVLEISGGEYCTYTDDAQFFSHRRAAITGRMAALVWIE